MEKEKLDRKLRFLIRWIFSDIVINLRSNNGVWKKHGADSEQVYKYGFKLDESNIGTIQLICIGVETFGRVFKGRKNERDCAKDCFVSFMKNFFPKEYHSVSMEIYKRYRCSLLHGHILGYKENFYPNRYERDARASHLSFGNEQLKPDSFVAEQDATHTRMVLDVDRFYNDFKHAVEIFCEKILKEKENILNVEKSLEDIPEEQ